MPRISVVIPAYNAEPYLPRTIESVLAQTVTDWELVIVDDGSTDGTAAVATGYAERDSRLRVVRQDHVGGGKGDGAPGTRNRGFAATDRDSRYVAFLDADDVWERDALAVLLAGLESCPTAIAAHGLARFIDAHDQPFGDAAALARCRRGIAAGRLVPWPDGAPTTFEVLTFTNTVHTPGLVLFRRAALEAVLEPGGLFDVAAPRVEDYDLLVRVSRLGDIVLVDRTVLGYRQHNGQTSRQNRQMYRSQVYTRRKLLLSPKNTPGQRRTARYARWHRCHEQVRWAKADLKERRFERAARNLHQATRHYARFAQDLAVSIVRHDIRPTLARLSRRLARANAG